MDLAATAQAGALLTLPALLLAAAARWPGAAWLSPVVVAYALGVLAGNVGLPLRPALTEGLVTGAILLAIPLLIFPADFLAWLRLARRTALACALSFASVCLAALASALLLAPSVREGWIVAGMLVGTYTGSAPNMAAVGRALGVSPETLVLVTTTDLVVGGAFCFVLLSPAVRLVGRLLPPFPAREPAPPAPPPPVAPRPPSRRELLASGAAALALATLAVALAGAAASLAGPEREQMVAILVVSALGVLGSLAPRVRRLRASYPLGEYLTLVFCLGFGSLARADALLATSGGGRVLLWTALVLLGGVALHLLACRLAGIDRDTAVITTAAAIYGPPFVAPVAANLRNPELVLSGVTAALAGLALGTSLGLAVSWATRAALGG